MKKEIEMMKLHIERLELEIERLKLELSRLQAQDPKIIIVPHYPPAVIPMPYEPYWSIKPLYPCEDGPTCVSSFF